MIYNFHASHKPRFSDSSYFDEICDVCMVTENSPKAVEPCEAASYCADRYKDAIQHIDHKKDVA